jgi:hypothetical protein
MSAGPTASLAALLADLALFDRVGEPDSQALCLLRIAQQHLFYRQSVAAVRACRLGLEAAPGDRDLRGRLYAVLAHVLAQAQHPAAAVACYERADSELRLAKQPLAACAAALSACTLLSTWDKEEARRRLAGLLDLLAGAAAPELFAEALYLLGELELDEQFLERALLCAETAGAAAALLKPASPELLARIDGLRGAALLGLGRDEEAAPLLAAAIKKLRGVQRPTALARVLLWHGIFLEQQAALDDARACFREALHIQKQARHAKEVIELTLRLAESYRDNNAERTRYLLNALDYLRRLPRPAFAASATAQAIERTRTLLKELPVSALTEGIEHGLRELESPEPGGRMRA